MRPVDPSRLDLAREFRADPLGAHSAELEDLLRIMRWMPATGRFLSVQPEAGGAWYLAYCGGGKGTSLDIYADSPYQSQSDAAWAVFRMRWEALCGEVLQLGGDDPDPRSGQVIRSADWVAERILGYSDRFSVEQGGRIEFKVSSPCSGEYQAKIVRLRCGDHANIGMRSIDVPTSTAGAYPSRHQPVHAGSYVELPSAAWPTGDFTFQCSIWPTLPGDSEQALMANWDASAGLGYALILDQDGAVALRIGDGEEVRTVSTGTPTLPRHWYQVVASFDATNKTVRVAQRAITRYAADPTSAAVCEAVNIAPSDGPGLRIAAWHASAAPCHHCATLLAGGYYNGKLEAPMAAACALSAEDVDGLMARGSLHTLANLQGHWDFSRDIDNTKIVDVSPHQRHGEAVNLPTRAMKGRHWDGSEYNWSHKPEHYGAIHFHDDDLYDAGWDTDFSFDVPTDLASGLYCAHLTCGEAQDWIPFVVRPPTGTAQAPLAVVLPSASYWAYANRHTVIDFPGREQVRVSFTAADASGLYLHHHPELGLSMYDDHSDGSGVCYSSRLRPIVSIRPNEALWQLPADTHIIDWLDEAGIDYDIITEDDLDTHGMALLAPYRCVMTGTHPEYPSLAMLEALETYQASGGRFIYMGGNGFYWRVSYHPQLPGMMEMRRAEDGIRAWQAEGGEYYHASTGELGGMWRRMGKAPQSIAGVGMTAQGFDRSTYFLRTQQSLDPRIKFAFEGLAMDERIGDFGLIGGGAAGWEIDRADTALGTPPHTLVVAQADTFSAGYHWMKEELHHTHAAINGENCPHVHCDMVFYETPNGGAVFSFSSIAWAGALSHDNYHNNVARLTANVVKRFVDPDPFTLPT